MGGKKKNKNNNKNVDVVEEVEKEKAKEQQTQTQLADTVKQTNQLIEQPKTQIKVEDHKEGEKNQNTTLPVQQPKDVTYPVQIQTVTNDQISNQIAQAIVKTTEDQIHNIQDQKIIDVPHAHGTEMRIGEQITEAKQEDKKQQQAKLEQKQETKQELKQELKEERKQEHKQEHSQEKKDEKLQQPVELKIEQKVEQKPVLTQTQTHHHVQPLLPTIERPESIQVTMGSQMRPQQKKFVTPLFATQQNKIGQENQDLPYRHELMDGLDLIAKIDQQIMLQYPLQHQQDAHGTPQFSQNFNPVAYHYNESGLQQLKQPGVVHEKQPNQVLKDKRLDDREALQQIKRSAQSVDPVPLVEVVQEKEKINILKSYHSQSAEQEKKKTPTSVKDRSIEKQIPSHREVSRKESLRDKSRRSSQTRHPDVPAFPLENPTAKSIQRIESAKKLDTEEVNKQILKQRQEEWRKMQERAAEPKRPSFIYVQPTQDVALDAVQPAKPHVPEHLGYTNNLPIIHQERQARKQSGDGQSMIKQTKSPYQQYKEEIKKQKQQIKEKLQEIEQLGKDVNKDNSLRKLSIAALVTVACFGACVLGKVDKRIAGGATVASFIVTYLAQK